MKIAEACGWIEVVGGSGGDPNERIWRKAGIGKRRYELPDFLSDLNAMHEAEKVLNAYQRHKYSIILRGDCASVDAAWTILNASAAQRAEAFGKTLGLW